MDTPITISSTLSNPDKRGRSLVQPKSEPSRTRVPVSWDSSFYEREETNCTPNSLQKVNNWINSLNKFQRGYVASSRSSDSSELDMHENGLSTDGDIVNSRAVGSSGVSLEAQITEGNSNESSASLKKYNRVNGSHKDSTLSGGGPGRRFYPSKKKRGKSIFSEPMQNEEVEKSDEYESDVPMSPESEKKKELCSYLQLMKPCEKKTIMILQNRRSVRVKNLNIMQEKRQLEKKLKENTTENSTDVDPQSDAGPKKFSSSKSLSEMRVDLDKSNRKWLICSGQKNPSGNKFVFPKPSVKLTENQSDFDLSQLDWFQKEKCEKTQNGAKNDTFPVNGQAKASPQPFKMPKLPEIFNSKNSDFDGLLEASGIVPLKKKLKGKKSTKQSKSVQRKKSFKIKLKPKSSSKGENKPSLLISDIIRSLRNRNVDVASSLRKRRDQKSKKRKKRAEKSLLKETESSNVPPNNPTENEISPDSGTFDNLSPEHKKSLLLTNLGKEGSPPRLPIVAIYSSNQDESNESKTKSEYISQIVDAERPEEQEQKQEERRNASTDKENYSDRSTPVFSKIQDSSPPFVAFSKASEVLSLHRSLNVTKSTKSNLEMVGLSPSSWTSDSPATKLKKSQHSINISNEHGAIVKAFYLEYNLVLCQEFMVSFWTQTALGNVLGAQNMWIHKGNVQRLAMNNNCILKEALEMVVSTENNVAYVELWTKEHQSEIREGPVADVFATVYFWKKGQNGLDKKVLQLENINGFADDVQYSVLTSSPKIIVSWHLASNEMNKKKTYIHCYHLAADYQTVHNIKAFDAVEHYVSSLHNIEGCDDLIMGCGENKITVWNIEHGYVVATVEMTEIKSPLCTLWVKCDRGFLFTLQQCVDRELRLIAINGMKQSWKKLASYVPSNEYDKLKGVCVENGIILAFYDQGIIGWNAQTSETVLEETPQSEAEYISGNFVISVANDQVNIRHAFTHLLSIEDSSRSNF